VRRSFRRGLALAVGLAALAGPAATLDRAAASGAAARSRAVVVVDLGNGDVRVQRIEFSGELTGVGALERAGFTRRRRSLAVGDRRPSRVCEFRVAVPVGDDRPANDDCGAGHRRHHTDGVHSVRGDERAGDCYDRRCDSLERRRTEPLDRSGFPDLEQRATDRRRGRTHVVLVAVGS